MIIVTGDMPACMPKNRMHYQQKRAGRVGAGAVPLGDVIPNPAFHDQRTGHNDW